MPGITSCARMETGTATCRRWRIGSPLRMPNCCMTRSPNAGSARAKAANPSTSTSAAATTGATARASLRSSVRITCPAPAASPLRCVNTLPPCLRQRIRPMSPTSAPATARRAIHASQAHASTAMAADHSRPKPKPQHAKTTTPGKPIATTNAITNPTARSRANAGAPSPARANAVQIGQHHRMPARSNVHASMRRFKPERRASRA